MKSKWVLALLVGTLGAAVYGGVALATPQSGVTTTILAKSTFGEIDLNAHTIPADTWQARLKTHGLTDAYVVDNKFAPGGTTGWHTHPGPSLIFVVAGTVSNYTSDDPSCTPQVYTAGQSFIDEGGGDVHIIRNESSTTAAETIAVQFLPQGSVRKTDAPAPGNCPF
jgi:quercetin dioxygenase-like cupin family protein